eukprot:Protomagalhaensia_sp_Gyna_25__2137@NODE_2157_length_1255_cov_110_542763_g1734_i1_p1_GENE_NODE_2157_length_1255_cov_110_542763_g1734_i1NODE_2157_length_1255_cov_110_542763_g1734_i1_p1_ORF_typecomplete_len333_score22_07CPBP/PF02517_16/4_5e02CPBP/PF02517_16/4_4e10AA_permease/PF00324_21/0_01DUF4735/PF15882_5/2_8e02DUF4735/PF15882_5/1_8_NODE_2157_length_1255_cov_110_542763_g1734_i1841082
MVEVVEWRPLPVEFEGGTVPVRTALLTGVLAGLGPLLVMVLSLDGLLPSGLRAMYLMHFVTMMGIPILLVKLQFKDEIYFRCWWHSQIHYHARSQLFWMVLLATVSCLYGVLGGQFVVLRVWTGPNGPLELVHRLKQNLDLNDPWTIVCGVWFGFVNPVIEEWFWRVWLWKELGSRCFSWKTEEREVSIERQVSIEAHLEQSQRHVRKQRHGGVVVTPSILGGHLDNFLFFTDSLEEGNTVSLLEDHKVAYDDVRISIVGQILISCLYVSYHVKVLWVFTKDPLITILGGCDLFVYGMIFGLLRSDSRFGWWAAVGFHAGLDLALLLSFVFW